MKQFVFQIYKQLQPVTSLIQLSDRTAHFIQKINH